MSFALHTVEAHILELRICQDLVLCLNTTATAPPSSNYALQPERPALQATWKSSIIILQYLALRLAATLHTHSQKRTMLF